jgi:NitT/TauT family transport system permease protein
MASTDLEAGAPVVDTDDIPQSQPFIRRRVRAAPSSRSAILWAVGPPLLTVGLVVTGIVLWEVAANREWINATFSSSPSDIWEASIDWYGSERFRTSTRATFEATAIAFVIGTVFGTVFGFALGLSRLLDRVIGPLLVPLNSIPRIALAPLFLLWFGLTTTAKVWLAVSIVFFVLAFNARSAVKGVDPDLLVMARVIGFRRRHVLLKVLWPSAVPTVFAGVRLAITYSLLGVVASEMIASRNGLGQDIVYFSGTFKLASMFAVLLELVIVATAVNIAAEFVERRLLRWQRIAS